MCALNTLQSNAATIARTVAERDKKRHLSIPETIQHAKRAGLSVSVVQYVKYLLQEYMVTQGMILHGKNDLGR